MREEVRGLVMMSGGQFMKAYQGGSSLSRAFISLDGRLVKLLSKWEYTRERDVRSRCGREIIR